MYFNFHNFGTTYIIRFNHIIYINTEKFFYIIIAPCIHILMNHTCKLTKKKGKNYKQAFFTKYYIEILNTFENFKRLVLQVHIIRSKS